MIGNLENLADEWERLAKRKLRSAEHEEDQMGRRLIEHGATCYLNCARALREYLVVATVFTNGYAVENKDCAGNWYRLTRYYADKEKACEVIKWLISSNPDQAFRLVQEITEKHVLDV